jgi:hypothetical protein
MQVSLIFAVAKFCLNRKHFHGFIYSASNYELNRFILNKYTRTKHTHCLIINVSTHSITDE